MFVFIVFMAILAVILDSAENQTRRCRNELHEEKNPVWFKRKETEQEEHPIWIQYTIIAFFISGACYLLYFFLTRPLPKPPTF